MNESRHGCKWRVRHIRLYCSTSVSTYRTATRTACSPICQASSFSIRHPRCHKQRTAVSVRVVVVVVVVVTIIIIIIIIIITIIIIIITIIIIIITTTAATTTNTSTVR